MSRQQLYTWRRELRRHGALRPPGPAEGHPVLVPVAPTVPPAPVPQEPVLAFTPAAQPVQPREDVVEIVLANGRLLRVPSGLEEAALARLIRIAEAA